MNILFVNSKYKLFKDSNSGASNRSTMFIQSLSQHAHVDVVSFAGSCQSDIVNCDVVYCSKDDNSEDSCRNLAEETKIGRFKYWFQEIQRLLPPYRVEDYYGCDMVKSLIVKHIVESKHYDYIACRYIEDAVQCSLIQYSKKLIIDVDDNPADVALMVKGKTCGLISSFHLKLYAHAIASATKKFLSRVYCSFYSSPNRPPYKASVFLPNVALLDNDIADVNEDTSNIILMVGWLDYAPNRNGALHFAKNVFPSIKDVVSDAVFYVVGKSNDPEVNNQLSKIEGVMPLGFVQDLTDVYRRSKVVVIPVYEGTGTSIKLLEALQMNRPVVTTQVGIRGYDGNFVDGKDLLVAANDDEFAKKVTKLLKSDVHELNELAHSGRSVVRNNFSKNKFVEIVNGAIK